MASFTVLANTNILVDNVANFSLCTLRSLVCEIAVASLNKALRFSSFTVSLLVSFIDLANSVALAATAFALLLTTTQIQIMWW